jgi:hypothetical protein
MQKPILFISADHPDYCSASLLHGLREVFQESIVDWPKYESVYNSFDEKKRQKVYGQGFTLFFNLEETQVDRDRVREKVASGFFSLIIFSDIWNQTDLFREFLPHLTSKNTILIDGQDTDQVVPYAGKWWRHSASLGKLKATKRFIYFKRELTANSRFNLWHRFLPSSLRCLLPYSKNLNKISFGIPESKILPSPKQKTKDFPSHIVDPEVADMVPSSRTSYAFACEDVYYNDLQISRYGITTKRAGWDCLRHYEIAANGAVPCFRNLQDKPATCAPHGLVVGVNCLSYSNASDLFSQINAIQPEFYNELQSNAMDWVRQKTTKMVASKLLRVRAENLGNFQRESNKN